MSDEITTASETDLGGAEGLGVAEQTSDTSVSAPSFDYSPYADHVVELKVGGEVQRVPLKDALSGYMRQADYTQKTQEIAEQRQSLEFAESIARALEVDPERTVNYLADLYLSEGGEVDDTQFAEMTPEEQRIATLEEGLAEQQEFQTQLEIQQEINDLAKKYGDRFDAQVVLNHAVASQIPDLDLAFRDLQFEQLQKLEAQRATETASKQDAARAAGVVSGGHTAASGSVIAGAGNARPSIRQAWELAKQQS